jgi:hypothetical protein
LYRNLHLSSSLIPFSCSPCCFKILSCVTCNRFHPPRLAL